MLPVDEDAEAPADLAKVPLIFIHGLKGSVLRDAGRRVAWLTGLQVLGLTRRGLALPLEWRGESQAHDGLRASEPLRAVDVVPGLVRRDFYGSWLDAARSWGRPFDVLAYDWRRDNHEAAEDLEERLDAIRQRYGTPAQVVAHSMGGLIALAVLNRRPDLFAGAVLCGSPIGGGLGFLEDMHCGPPVGFNRGLLDQRTLFSFPSVYTFFPESGEGLFDADGTALPMDFFDATAWARRRLGLFALEPGDASREAWLQKTLDRAKDFRRLLSARRISYPPVTVVASQTLPTLDTVIRDGPHSVRGWDFVSRPKAPGDGRVRHRSAMVPEGIPARVCESAREHSEILNDFEMLRDVLEEQLRAGPRRAPGLSGIPPA